MKRIFLILAILAAMIACTNSGTNPDNLTDAVITGYDPRDCICCGGWLINIANVSYNFDDLPKESGIELEKAVLPLNVRVSWMMDTIPCGSRIIIKKIQKR